MTSEASPWPQPFDPALRARLLLHIGNIDDPSQPRPLVNLELFFEGNHDSGSIGYNLPSLPGPSALYAFYKRIRDRREVREVLVEVKGLEDPEGWPWTDTVWLITSADVMTIRGWYPEDIAPDDMWEGFEDGQSNVQSYEVPQGYRPIAAWYD